MKHFHSPLPPYRGEDLRFLSKIEDCDQPSLPIDNMERDIVHEATGIVRHYNNTEGFQQRAQSLLVLRMRRDTEGPRRPSVIEQPRPLPAVRLIDLQGRQLTLAGEIGRAVVVEFIYATCPDR